MDCLLPAVKVSCYFAVMRHTHSLDSSVTRILAVNEMTSACEEVSYSSRKTTYTCKKIAIILYSIVVSIGVTNR